MALGYGTRQLHEALKALGFVRSSYSLHTVYHRSYSREFGDTKEPMYGVATFRGGREIEQKAADAAEQLAAQEFTVAVYRLDGRLVYVSVTTEYNPARTVTIVDCKSEDN